MAARCAQRLTFALLIATGCGGRIETTDSSIDAGSTREAGDDVSITDATGGPLNDLATEALESAVDTPNERIDAAFDSGADVGLPRDGPAGDNDAPPPPCVERGGIYFARPSTFGPISLVIGVALAANRDRRVAFVFGEPGFTSYVDSLDGGRTFRSLLRLGQLGPDNMLVAIGPRDVYISSANFSKGLMTYGVAEIDSFLDPAQLVHFDFAGATSARMVPNSDGWLALLVGSFVSVAKTPLAADFSPRVEVSKAEVCAGLWHSSGTFYVGVPFNAYPPPARLDIHWSNDAGATFSAPLMISSPVDQFQCPKLYEQADGNILIITVAGFNTTGEQQFFALTLDHATKQITRTTMVPRQARTRCLDSVRVSKRTYVMATTGDAATISRVDLTYSDDDGVTWAPPVEVPYLDGAGCTTIAASRDEVYFHWRTATGDPMRSDRMMHLARLGEMSACE